MAAEEVNIGHGSLVLSIRKPEAELVSYVDMYNDSETGQRNGWAENHRTI